MFRLAFSRPAGKRKKCAPPHPPTVPKSKRVTPVSRSGIRGMIARGRKALERHSQSRRGRAFHLHVPVREHEGAAEGFLSFHGGTDDATYIDAVRRPDAPRPAGNAWPAAPSRYADRKVYLARARRRPAVPYSCATTTWRPSCSRPRRAASWMWRARSPLCARADRR